MSEPTIPEGVEAVVDPAAIAANDTSAADERAELAKLFEETNAAETPAPDATPADTGLAAAKQTPAAAAGEDEPDIVRQIRAREQAQGIRDRAQEDANAYREKLLADAKAEAERIATEGRAQLQSEREAWAKQLKEDPLGAINGAGVDKRALLDGVIKSDDPVYIARQAEARARALEEKIAQLEKQPNKAFEEYRQQQDAAAQHQARAATERAWIDTVKAEVPALFTQAEAAAAAMRAAGWETITLPSGAVVPTTPESVLVNRGYIESRKVSDMLGMPQNQVAPVNKVVEYLKYQAKQAGVSTVPGTATKSGQVTAPRTLSSSAASERRSSPRPDTPATREELAALFDSIVAEEKAQSR